MTLVTEDINYRGKVLSRTYFFFSLSDRKIKRSKTQWGTKYSNMEYQHSSILLRLKHLQMTFQFSGTQDLYWHLRIYMCVCVYIFIFKKTLLQVSEVLKGRDYFKYILGAFSQWNYRHIIIEWKIPDGLSWSNLYTSKRDIML